MIKILQYGEGNFLRTFVDVYFDALNKNGQGMYAVNIVKPITFGTLERFKKQNNKYHIILRGTENGKTVENVYKVDSLEKVIDPFVDYQSYIDLAKDPELKIIVSNTTEAGICYNEKDEIKSFDGITYPAKLTKFLFERFNAGLDGVYLLPVELIDNNADELKKCVDKYISLWSLPEAFKKWNDEQNFYCNTLVDRIVSGYPRDEETKAHLETLIGEKDELVSIGEPFGLWAVEKKGNIAEYIKEGVHNIEVVLTNDIGYYKKRKVRVLNGSHTNLVPTGLMLGAAIVFTSEYTEGLDIRLFMTVHMCTYFLTSLALMLGLHLIPVGGAPIERIVFTLSPLPLLGALLFGLLTVGLCWLMRNEATRHLPPALVSVIAPFAAPITAVISVLTGYESPTPSLILASLLILAAAILSGLSERPKEKPPVPQAPRSLS